MIAKTFQEFLDEKFYKDNPMTLDDDWPDAYADWESDLDVAKVIDYAEEWGRQLLAYGGYFEKKVA